MALLEMRDGESIEANTMRYVRKCGYYNSAVERAIRDLKSGSYPVAEICDYLQAALDYQGDDIDA